MINCCNELNAGYAADGYARTSESNIAVVVVTYMVGSLSILNAIAGACSEGLKVIVLCGGPESRSYSNNAVVHHSLGIPNKDQSRQVFTQVTCASIRLDEESTTSNIDHALQECLKQSLPIYIEIPADIATKVFFDSTDVGPFIRPCSSSGELGSTEDYVSCVRQVCASARMPVVIVGGARNVLSKEVTDQFISTIGCAAFYLLDGKSQLSETHPQCGGLFWSIVSHEGVEAAVLESDLWITIGCRWNDLHTLGSLKISAEKPRILAIGDSFIRTPDGHTIRNISTMAVVEDITRAGLLPNNTSLNAFKLYRDSGRRSALPQPESANLIPLDSVVDRISSIIKRDDTVVADAGESWFTASRIRLAAGTDFQVQLLYSSTGWSLPAALGCCIARGKGRSIVVIGDGSFQMTCQELSTMRRYQVNAIVVIINNKGYQIEVTST